VSFEGYYTAARCAHTQRTKHNLPCVYIIMPFPHYTKVLVSSPYLIWFGDAFSFPRTLEAIWMASHRRAGTDFHCHSQA